MFSAILFSTLIWTSEPVDKVDKDSSSQEPNEASDNRLFIARNALAETALNPQHLPIDPDYDGNTLRAQYFGDDWGWPVYAFALEWKIDQVCREDLCDHQWRALMNRAPAAPDADSSNANFRPRWRGSFTTRVLANLIGQNPSTPLTELIANLPIERVVANSHTCSGQINHLGALAETTWLNEETIAQLRLPVDTSGRIVIMGHADTVNVEFEGRWGTITSRGLMPEPGNVAGWIDDLIDALEPCWQPRE
jgi:hypothetical protein